MAAVRTDIGKIRDLNEDYVFVSEKFPNDLILGIVADGMGGHSAGEIASSMAVAAIYKELQVVIKEKLSIDEYRQALEQAIINANKEVYLKSISNEEYQGMGTTVIAAIINPEWIILGHIGDSRAYLSDGNKITQLTSDHSLVNELLKNGHISEEEANNHPQKNILIRALGTEENVKIDMKVINWEHNNKLLLCSDGLTNQISASEILEIINLPLSIEERANHLITSANISGGEDNISLIIVENK